MTGPTPPATHRPSLQAVLPICGKAVGSAQRRTGGRVLHHGSIKLGSSQYDTGVAELDGIADPSELAWELTEVFREQAGIRLQPGVPTREERILADELGERALDRDFVRRR